MAGILESYLAGLDEQPEPVSPERGKQDYYATVGEKLAKGMDMEPPSGLKLADQVIGKQFEGVRGGFNQVMTFGLQDELEAAGDWARDLVNGGDSQSYMEHLDKSAQYYEDLNKEVPLATQLVGQGLGIGMQAALTGPISAAAVTSQAARNPKGIASAVSNFATSRPKTALTGLAAGEGAVTALNEGGDPVTGGITGGLAGLGLGWIAIPLQKALNRKQLGRTRGEARAYDELWMTLNQHGKRLTPEQKAEWTEQLNKLGPNATLADIGPEFQDLLFASITAGKNSKRQLEATKIMADRKSMLPKQFEAELDTLFGGRAMSRKQLDLIAKERAAVLAPQYQKILQEHAGNTVPATRVKDTVLGVFKGGKDPITGKRVTYGGQLPGVKRNVNKLLDDFTSEYTMPDGAKLSYMTTDQVRQLRAELDGMLSAGKYTTKKGKEITINKDLKRRLSQARKVIDTEFKDMAPGIADLDAQYVIGHQVTDAYDEGVKFAGNAKAYSAADAEVFLTNATAPQIIYAAEGFKSQLIKRIAKAATPKAKLKILKDPEMRNKADTLFGTDLANNLYAALEKNALLSETADLTAGAARVAANIRRGGVSEAQKLQDISMAASPASGAGSFIGAMGALRRLLQHSGLNLPKSGMRKLDEMYSMQGTDAVNTLEELFNYSSGGKPPAFPPGLGVLPQGHENRD